MTLQDILNRREDVKFSEIPDFWKESFDRFMLGQTCYMVDNEFVAYFCDFNSWYRINEQSILRDIKITSIDESI